MKKETLYLDTSVISAYCDERAIEQQETTVKFWEGDAHEKDRIF